MVTRTIFVGDVHLHPRGDSPAGKNRRFLDFLDARRRDTAAVYLLGDIFDYWIGPKMIGSGEYAGALDALAALTKSGVALWWIHGNRDYLIERRFAAKTGVKILGDGVMLTLGGRTVYAAHGDFIYNKNTNYTAYRRLMNFAIPRAIFTSIPRAVGSGMAKGFRTVSRKTTPAYRWTRDDIVAGAKRHFERGADLLICGHIHLPMHVECSHRSKPRDIYVLGDWDGNAEYVEFDGDRFAFRTP
jgi:UDP-2,3-diacylglucosamine hydrolase